MLDTANLERVRTLLREDPTSPHLSTLFDGFFEAFGAPPLPPHGLSAWQLMSWERKQPSHWKDLRNALGSAVSRQADRWIFEGLCRRLGPTDETVLRLGMSYLKGRLYDADTQDASIAANIVQGHRLALGDAAPKTQLARLYQAEILATLERFDDACLVLTEMLQDPTLNADDEHRGTAAFMLGISTLRSGRIAQGLALLEAHRQAGTSRKSLRPGDLIMFPKRGNGARAEAIAELEATIDAWGFGKTQTVDALSRLAQHLEHTDDADCAEIARALHQVWQDDLVRSYPEEGIVLSRKIASQGRRKEAIKLAQTMIEAMRAIEERWSPAKGHRRMATHDLSGWLRDEGDIDGAIKSLEPVAQEMLDEGAPPFLIVGNDLGYYCLRNDQIDDALSWFQAVLEQLDSDECAEIDDDDVAIDTDEQRATAGYGIAICQGRKGRADEEEQSLLTLLDELEEAQKLTTSTAFAVVERLLAILIPRNDRRAIVLQEKLVQAAESTGHAHATQRERHNLGTVLAQLGETQSAEKLFREVLEAQMKLWGEHAPESIDLWRTKRSLAKLLRDTSRNVEADAVDPGPERPNSPNLPAGYQGFRPLR